MQVDNNERSYPKNQTNEMHNNPMHNNQVHSNQMHNNQIHSNQFNSAQSNGVPIPERKLPSTQPPSYYGVHMTSYTKQQTNAAPFSGSYGDRLFSNDYQGRCYGNQQVYQQLTTRNAGDGMIM